MEKIKAVIKDNRDVIVSCIIECVCGMLSAIAVLFTVHLMIKAGLVQVVVWILLMIPTILLGSKLAAWVNSKR